MDLSKMDADNWVNEEKKLLDIGANGDRAKEFAPFADEIVERTSKGEGLYNVFVSIRNREAGKETVETEDDSVHITSPNGSDANVVESEKPNDSKPWDAF